MTTFLDSLKFIEVLHTETNHGHRVLDDHCD